MGARADRLDLGVVCRLVVDHLRRDGVDASARGSEFRVPPRLTFKLRSEPGDGDGLASRFWIEVDGLRLEPPMRLDVSGWGLTFEDQATDAAHGILESILPPVRWLASEPWAPPDAHAGRVQRVRTTGGEAWTVVIGDPWIVAALAEDGSPDDVVASLRSDLAATALTSLDPIDEILDRLQQIPSGHWLKIFAGRYGTEAQGRIDVDNQIHIEGAPLAAALPWQAIDGVQLVRQLIVLRPDNERPRQSRGRFGISFARRSPN